MSDIYLRLKPTTENEKIVERFICGDVQWGGRETRMLDHALSFVSRDEALAHVKAHRLDPGYRLHEATHDCGEIGGLAQHRRRFLLVARREKAVTAYVYQPPKQRVKGCGEVLGELPMPNEPSAGPLHKLPKISWLNWVRLALIPAGDALLDYRDPPQTERSDRLVAMEQQLKKAQQGLGTCGLYRHGAAAKLLHVRTSDCVAFEFVRSTNEVAIREEEPDYKRRYAELATATHESLRAHAVNEEKRADDMAKRLSATDEELVQLRGENRTLRERLAAKGDK